MLKLTGLWESKDKNGNLMLSGRLTYDTKAIVLKNNFKENDTDPDYFLYIDEYLRKEKRMVFAIPNPTERKKDIREDSNVDKKLLIRKKSEAPSVDLKHPLIFCCNFAILISRSARLLSNGA